MRLHQRVLRLICRKTEDQRMEYRHAVRMLDACAEDILRTCALVRRKPRLIHQKGVEHESATA